MRDGRAERFDVQDTPPGQDYRATTGLVWRWTVACSVIPFFQLAGHELALYFVPHQVAIVVASSVASGIMFPLALVRLGLMPVAAANVARFRRWRLLPPL